MSVVYIDLLFFLNLIANYLLLLGTGRLAGAILRRLRICLAGALGALYAVAVFLPGMGWLGAWPCKLLCGFLMVLVAYGWERRLLRIIVFFFGASAGLAGLVLGVELLGGVTLTAGNGVFYSQPDLRLLLFLFVACYFLLSLCFRGVGRHTTQEVVDMVLIIECHKIHLAALLDSGHTLTDPATNRPVVVADYTALAPYLPVKVQPDRPVEGVKLCQQAGIKGARLIPYRAVGVDCGMLLALRARSVQAGGRALGELMVALSPTPVDDGGGFQALIGGI